MTFNERISDVVRTVRIARGLSTKEVAQRVGTRETTILDLENSVHGWSTKTILSVARALGVHPAILLMDRKQRLRAQTVL